MLRYTMHLQIMQSKRRRRNSTHNFNQHWTRHQSSWRYQNSDGWSDMNAKLGADNTGREAIMSREALGEVMNENGELFAEFCAFNDLVIGIRQCVQARGYPQSERHGFHHSPDTRTH
ncbi:unnamed protein product [Heterobilharzia americana]|nr:unnamed protein product [Heterobilharzia americana]